MSVVNGPRAAVEQITSELSRDPIDEVKIIGLSPDEVEQLAQREAFAEAQREEEARAIAVAQRRAARARRAAESMTDTVGTVDVSSEINTLDIDDRVIQARTSPITLLSTLQYITELPSIRRASSVGGVVDKHICMSTIALSSLLLILAIALVSIVVTVVLLVRRNVVSSKM